jgi:fumarate reductase subunit D
MRRILRTLLIVLWQVALVCALFAAMIGFGLALGWINERTHGALWGVVLVGCLVGLVYVVVTCVMAMWRDAWRETRP